MEEQEGPAVNEASALVLNIVGEIYQCEPEPWIKLHISLKQLQRQGITLPRFLAAARNSLPLN